MKTTINMTLSKKLAKYGWVNVGYGSSRWVYAHDETNIVVKIARNASGLMHAMQEGRYNSKIPFLKPLHIGMGGRLLVQKRVPIAEDQYWNDNVFDVASEREDIKRWLSEHDVNLSDKQIADSEYLSHNVGIDDGKFVLIDAGEYLPGMSDASLEYEYRELLDELSVILEKFRK